MNAVQLMSSIQSWPVWVGVAVLAIAAGLYARDGRVPNWYSYATILGGWLVAGLVTGPGHAPSLGGSLASSLICTFSALAMLIFFYTHYDLGAGCVKAQMAFAAWVGAGLAVGPAMLFVFGATVGGVLVTGVGMWLAYLRTRRNNDHDEINEPWPTALLFPAQITLSLGSIAGALAMFVIAAARAGN